MSQWSIEKTDKLKDLFKKGLTFSQIAAELNSNRSSVAGKLSRLGMRRKRQSYYRYSAERLPRALTPRVISQFGEWHKVGVFKHCKWLDDNKRFCHEPVEPESPFAFCPDHMKRAIRKRRTHNAPYKRNRYDLH